MTAFQPKEHLLSSVTMAQDRLIKDLKAIPPDKNGACPGGCARSPLDIVVECGRINRLVGTSLNTGKAERMPPEEQETQLKSLDTCEKALAYLDTETRFLLDAIQNFDEDRLGDISSDFIRIPMTHFAIAQLPGLHMMYHDGQLNYIQTLFGDDKIHWFD